jgi:Ca2+-binding EF-hand superfamily protein
MKHVKQIQSGLVIAAAAVAVALVLRISPGPEQGPVSPSLWLLVVLSALANIFVLAYHHTVPAHPKFLILPRRRMVLMMHIISGTMEFVFGLTALVYGGHLFWGRVMAAVAIGLHVPTALLQASWVFGSRAVMRPAYLMCIGLHGYAAVMLFLNPDSLQWTIATFVLFNTYVWVRIYYYVIDKLGLFGDSKYTVAVLAAGLTTTPVVLGREALLGIAVSLGVYIVTHMAFFVRSAADMREFTRERARDSALSPGLRAAWQRKPGLEGEERELARGLFRALDRDNDGIVTAAEVEEVLANANLPTGAIAAFMRRQGNDGAMRFDTFLAQIWPIAELRAVSREIIFTHGGPKADRDRALFVFDLLDINGDGTIDQSELQALLDEWAMPRAEAERWTRRLGLGPGQPIEFELFFTQMRPIWRFIYYDVIEPQYGKKEDMLERVLHQRHDAEDARRVELQLRADHLGSLPLFEQAEAGFLSELAQSMVPIERKKTEVIFREGDPGDAFFLIASGAVAVSRRGAPVATLGPGQCLGEGALLHDRARSAEAVTTTDTLLLRASAASFRYLLERYPAMRQTLQNLDLDRA